MSLTPCPYCRTGSILLTRVDSNITHNNRKEVVTLRVKKCNSCGEEFEDKGCDNHNKGVILTKRKEINQQENTVVVSLCDWRKCNG